MARTQEEEEQDAFSPARGNVAFASAADGWAFRLEQFAAIYAGRLGCSAAALRRGLWGDWCALRPGPAWPGRAQPGAARGRGKVAYMCACGAAARGAARGA